LPNGNQHSKHSSSAEKEKIVKLV